MQNQQATSTLKWLLLGLIGVIAISLFILQPDKPATLPDFEQLEMGEDGAGRAEFDRIRFQDPKTKQIPEGIRTRELRFIQDLPIRLEGAALNKTSADVLSWTQRGPYNVGGRTRAVLYDVSDATYNTLIAGSPTGGVWRTTNGGDSWSRSTLNPLAGFYELHNVTALTQDTRSGKTATWYFAGGEYGTSHGANGYFTLLGEGIWKSTDSGVSWTQLNANIGSAPSPQSWNSRFDYVWDLAIDPSNTSQDEIYAACASDLIMRSTNGGTSWSVVLGAFGSSSRYTDVAVSSTGRVYATFGNVSGSASTKGIFTSSSGDSGSFTNITPAALTGNYRRIEIAISPSNEDIVYFLANTPGAGTRDHMLFKYQLSTNTWTDLSENIPNYGSFQNGIFSSQGSYDLLVKVNPSNEDQIYIGGTSLYRLTFSPPATAATESVQIGGYSNTGDNWSGVTGYIDQHADQHALTFRPGSSTIAVSGHDGGISFTNDITASTVVWDNQNNGYNTTQFYSAAVAPNMSGDNVLVGGMQDNGSWFVNSSSPTANWVDELSGDGSFAAISDNKGYYYFSWQNGTIYRFRLDGAGGLLGFRRVDPTGASGYQFINPFILDPTNTARMYLAGGTTIWRNSNLEDAAITEGSNSTLATNWTQLSGTNVSGESISAVSASTSPANHVFYGTIGGRIYRLDNADAATAASVPVEITGSGMAGSSKYTSSIAIDPTDANKVLVTYSNYSIISVYYTTNALSATPTWTNVSGNIEQNADGSGNGPAVLWGTIMPYQGGTLYALGTSTGLYLSTSVNGSTTWTREAGVGIMPISMVVPRMKDANLFVATFGNGMFQGTGLTALPIQVAGFMATQEQDNAILEWRAFSQSNIDAFVIEHAFGANAPFKEAFTINPENKDAPENAYRRKMPNLLPGHHRFRLKQVSTDGRIYYTDEVGLDVALANKFLLSEAYPNPFNPQTKFHFATATSQRVTVKVFNALGKQVATLYQGTVPANETQFITFEGNGLASGLYLVQVLGQNFSAVRKVNLVK